MTWDELVDEFRALGGIAENVRLGEGPYGRGVFVIDSQQPAKLWAPDTMFIRLEDIATPDGRMTVTNERYDPAVRALFEHYEERFGWGAGGREASYTMQAAWHALPEDIANMLRGTGGLDRPLQRFLAPTEELALHDYLCTRQFRRGNDHYIVPLIDLVNHAGTARPYIEQGGFGVEGVFADEMLVSYSHTDGWTKALNYGFAASAPVAHSIGATITLPGNRRLSISRDLLNRTVEDGVYLPALTLDGDEILLSYLELGLARSPDLPRAIFFKLMQRAGVAQADYVFDSIAGYNRAQFITLLRLLRKHDGPLVRVLEEAVINQLDALNACVGARSL
jgi:hypothetical protein